MAIFSGDAVIKKSIELMIKEVRENPYLIADILGDFTSNPYLKDDFGQKQIDSCKEWIKNNQVDVYLFGRTDKDRYPSVSIFMAPSPEKADMKRMADDSPFNVTLLPKQIGKPIPYVVKPFVPAGYDRVSGILTAPDDVDLITVAASQILVNPANGKGLPILDVIGQDIYVQPNTDLVASTLGIVPQYQFYQARIKQIYTQDTYHITCKANDPSSLLWLWQITLYGILRYKETLLEAVGFTETVIQNGDVSTDSDFTTGGGEAVWQRRITITGQVEQTWISSPKRTLESVVLRELTADGYEGGIKIASNLDSPDFLDRQEETWLTIEDDEI